MTEGSKIIPDLELRDFSVFEACPDYIIVVDGNWNLAYANPSFLERFGTSGSIPGSQFFTFLDTPSAARVRESDQELLEAGRQIDLSMLAPDARTVTVHYCFFPLPHLSARKPLFAGIGRDRAGDLGALLEVIQLNLELERKRKVLAEANARLEQQAITDQITQLYNRHYFFQVAQHFWEEARRYRLPLTLMMMDLDDFKSINDNYGHLFGDYVLAQASSRLKGTTRKSDILARYGGEEIVLLASNTDQPTGLVLAERLRLAVGSGEFVMGNCRANVTVSVGVSGTELGEFSAFEALLDSSDQALYGAKHAGKNCVFQFDRGPAPRL